MKVNKIINIGVLGCADIAQRYIIPTLLNPRNNFSLVGVASRTKEKANIISEIFNTKAYHSYRELLDIDCLEAIYIPLPNSMHYEWVKKSLSRGLHVLVEKSLACSYEEVLELNKLATHHKLVLIENFQFRFHSQLKYILNILNKGYIGDLRNIRSSFGFPPFPNKDNIRYNKILGGGALLDAGAYLIKISQIILGSNVYVDSASLTFPADYEVDIYGSGCIRDNYTKIGNQIAFGFDNYYQCCLEIWGSEGKITTDRIFTAPPKYKPRIVIASKDGTETILLDEDNHFENMIQYFYNQIINKSFISECNANILQAKLINSFKNMAG